MPPNANAPRVASRSVALEFFERAARYRGKSSDRARLERAFDERRRELDDETPTLWASVCVEMGFADEDGLDVLCQNGINWSPALLQADIGGDRMQEYLLFGTWTVGAHQDALLAIFTPEGQSLRRLPIPNEPPFDDTGEPTFHSYGRPMLRRLGGKTFIDDSAFERWDAAGEPIGWSPIAEPARTKTTIKSYRFDAGRPVLVQTRVEQWSKKGGKHTEVIPAKP